MNVIWNTKKVKIKDLIPDEQNPRKITGKDLEILKQKIESLGVFSIPTIDHNGILLTFHQRYKALLMLGYGDKEIDVLYPNRVLTDSERKQINLSSNHNDGDWDKDLLKEHFGEIDLKALGLDIELDLKDFDTGDFENIEPIYPITAKAAEKYSLIMIVCESEIDINNLSVFFGLETEKCYKTTRIGQTLVVKAKKVLQKINQK